MKKIISMLLVVSLCCGMIVGCGGKQKTIDKDEKIVKNETIQGDFDETTNITVQIKGIQFEVPSKWEESEIASNESEESVKCFKSEDIYLKVIYGSHAIDKLNDELYEAYLTGLGTRLDSFEIDKISEGNYNGREAKTADVSFIVETEQYSGNVFTFETADFIFGVKQNTERNYDLDIQKVLESIEIIEYEEVAKDLNYIFLQENMRWNMAKEEVKDIEKREVNTLGSLENGSMSYLNYEPNKKTDEYFSSVELIYCFEDDLLKAYWCSYDETQISDYRGLYDKIKETVSAKYGECESESVNWTDTTYQNDENKWNDAFRYGYVTIETVWHTADTAIVINWDYNSTLTVATSELAFEDRL